MLETAYNRLLEKVLFPAGDRLTGACLMKKLNEYREFQNYSEKELLALQEDRMIRMMKFAVEKIPYYRSLNIGSIHDLSDIRKFPVLTKQILRDHNHHLLNPEEKVLIKMVSSGSSGIQSTTYWNREEESTYRAIQANWWNWAGYRLGEPVLQTGMATRRTFIKKTKDILLRTNYVYSFLGDRKEILKILQGMRGREGWTFGGYASSLNVFAEVALENNLTDIRFKTSISWGDKLFDHYRKNVTEAFGCKVHETYGCAEGILFGAQKDLDYLYLNIPHLYLELLDDSGNPVPDGQLGHVVVTRLDNTTMPFLRYKLGDLAIRLPREKYPEKREFAFPLLQKVVGRDTDVVKTRSGNTLIVHSFTGIFEYYPEVRQFRVVQKIKGAIDLEYIPAETFGPKVLNDLQERFRKLTGDDLEITWKEVDFIPSTPSGKPQIIKSELN